MQKHSNYNTIGKFILTSITVGRGVYMSAILKFGFPVVKRANSNKSFASSYFEMIYSRIWAIVMLRFCLDKHILNLIVLGLRLTQILEK